MHRNCPVRLNNRFPDGRQYHCARWVAQIKAATFDMATDGAVLDIRESLFDKGFHVLQQLRRHREVIRRQLTTHRLHCWYGKVNFLPRASSNLIILESDDSSSTLSLFLFSEAEGSASSSFARCPACLPNFSSNNTFSFRSNASFSSRSFFKLSTFSSKSPTC